MADEFTPNPPSTLSGMVSDAAALDEAIARARAELDAINAAAFEADQIAKQAPLYTVHEVPGMGRYAVARKRGWKSLLELVNDTAVDIDFNSDKYPFFDAIVVKATQNSPFLDDPLNYRYEEAQFVHLRENLAVVRNELMGIYYAHTPPGMSPEKAQQAMKQIAQFVGEGLYNNQLFLGVVPHHTWGKPFIDLALASQPDGAGAQYIYDKILEMQRQSSWMRPFSAVVALFGGKQPVDWMLPSVRTLLGGVHTDAPPDDQALAHMQETSAALASMRNERIALQETMEATAMAVDLEAMGNQLLHTAEQIQQGVETLAEPVKRNAIEIAKDILRKLKVGFGAIDLTAGLNLKPSDDMAALGAIQGVAIVYEKLLAWGRGIDASIAQHPSIMAATMAVGQMGYLAKLEALRVAKSVGNGALADRIATRIAALPEAYKAVGGLKFGDLLNRVEGGIDTVLNRIQEINGPGATVGFTRANELGNYMSGTPLAGMSGLARGDGVGNDAGKKNVAILQSQEVAERAQAQAIQSQAAQRQRQSGQQQQPAQPQQTRGTGRQQLRQARQQQQQSQASNRTTTTNPALLNQQQQAQRTAAWRAAHAHEADHSHDGHPAPAPVKIDPRLLNPALMNQIKATGINTNDLTTGKAAFSKMQNANTQGLKPSATPNLKAAASPLKPVAKTEEEKKKQQLLDAMVPPPPKGGMSR